MREALEHASPEERERYEKWQAHERQLFRKWAKEMHEWSKKFREQISGYLNQQGIGDGSMERPIIPEEKEELRRWADSLETDAKKQLISHAQQR